MHLLGLGFVINNNNPSGILWISLRAFLVLFHRSKSKLFRLCLQLLGLMPSLYLATWGNSSCGWPHAGCKEGDCDTRPLPEWRSTTIMWFQWLCTGQQCTGCCGVYRLICACQWQLKLRCDLLSQGAEAVFLPHRALCATIPKWFGLNNCGTPTTGDFRN